MTTTGLWKICIPLAAVVAVHGSALQAAESRFEIDLKELPKAATPPAKSAHPPAAKPARGKQPQKVGSGSASYTVKPGDHIFKILMRDFGLTNQQAELLIPEIARLNGISDIRRLQVGQVLQIPRHPASAGSREPGQKAPASIEPTPHPAPAAQVAEPPSVATAPLATPQPLVSVAAPPAEPAAEPPVAAASPQQTVPSAPEALPPGKPILVAICPMAAGERERLVEALLDLLAPGWVRNRIVEGGKESTDGSYVSIKVNRYFEHLGYRYIVNSETDPLTLTLLRLLEVQGDRVITIGTNEGAIGIAARIAAKMELSQEEGNFRVKCVDPPGGETSLHGIRIAPAGPGGQQLLITEEQAPKCTAELLAGR